jgi:hypothetical protein
MRSVQVTNSNGPLLSERINEFNVDTHLYKPMPTVWVSGPTSSLHSM